MRQRGACADTFLEILSLSLSLSLSLCVSLHVYSRRARERTTLVYIAVSDTWASSKSIPVQGVSVESQLAPRRLTTPRSRETTLVAELCVAGALPPFEKVASSVNWKFYRVSILILLSYPFLIPRGFSFSMERKVKKNRRKRVFRISFWGGFSTLQCWKLMIKLIIEQPCSSLILYCVFNPTRRDF